ncbi:hypothetical protein [Bradyrhizobium sp.]|uniref:hypothetical protein n=1 Tax=Bradyrhizobium sp. TaxID=376 RepID=UPI0039E5F096
MATTTKQPNPGQTSRVLHTQDPAAEHGNGERVKEARDRLQAIEGKVSSLQGDEQTIADIKADIEAVRQAL